MSSQSKRNAARAVLIAVCLLAIVGCSVSGDQPSLRDTTSTTSAPNTVVSNDAATTDSNTDTGGRPECPTYWVNLSNVGIFAQAYMGTPDNPNPFRDELIVFTFERGGITLNTNAGQPNGDNMYVGTLTPGDVINVTANWVYSDKPVAPGACTLSWTMPEPANEQPDIADAHDIKPGALVRITDANGADCSSGFSGSRTINGVVVFGWEHSFLSAPVSPLSSGFWVMQPDGDQCFVPAFASGFDPLEVSTGLHPQTVILVKAGEATPAAAIVGDTQKGEVKAKD